MYKVKLKFLKHVHVGNYFFKLDNFQILIVKLNVQGFEGICSVY